MTGGQRSPCYQSIASAPMRGGDEAETSRSRSQRRGVQSDGEGETHRVHGSN